MNRYYLYGFLLLATYLYGIHYLPLRGEEANRILTAYEIHYFGDFFNLTHLGEPYYAKPPLFMWLVLLFSKIFGWSQESARLISVFSSFLTALLTYLFSIRLFGDRKEAVISALLLLTFGDLALFYGFVAEIDAFHMFSFFLSVFLLYEALRRGKTLLAFSLSGFFTALLFLTKGFPAFYHIPVSFLILLIHFGKFRELFTPKLFLPFLTFLGPFALWLLNLKEPKVYLFHLWSESFSRTPIAEKGNFLKHLVLYPLLNFKQILPGGLFLLGFKAFKNLNLNGKVMLPLLLFLANYTPYLLSPGARGRYIIILFPFLAIFMVKLFYDIAEREINNRFWKIAFLFESSLLLLGSIFILKNWYFFENYNPLIAFLFLTVLIFSLIAFKMLKTPLLLLVLTVALLKFGYINYYAPFKEKKHPEREIALEFSKFIPKGSVIRYLPKRLDMEVCAYIDIFTKGIVLRNGGNYFLTTERELPKGAYTVIKNYKRWVLGKFK